MKKFDVMMSIRTDKDDRKNIQRLAKRLNMSKSDAIRHAVNSTLAFAKTTSRRLPVMKAKDIRIK